MAMSQDNIAIAHKDYDVRGGGEIVAEKLAETFAAPLYVGSFDLSKFPTEKQIDVTELFDSWWQQTLINRGGLTQSVAYRYLWQQDTDDLHDYDTLILSGNEPLWYVGPDDQTTIAYTHSTPRWMYDLFPTIESTPKGRIWKFILELQRRDYFQHTAKPDLYVANSDLVARRIKKYWNISAEQIRVVYPPVKTDDYDPGAATTQDYYLYFGRLVQPKRVDLLIDAFNDLDRELIIAGTGLATESLTDRAQGNITFKGYVSEEKKRSLLSGANALLFPAANEDFGMVPIEAMASGTPVLGVDDGFTKHQVQDGKNGILWDRSVANVQSAIKAFEEVGVAWCESEIAAFARENFGLKRFKTQMKNAVEVAQERSEINTEWIEP